VHADGALLDVDLVVNVLLHERSESREFDVPVRRPVGRTGDDERRSGLVDEDRVDLVDDGEGVPALHHFGFGVRHVVTEVVEAELVVGAVGDVGGVRYATLFGRHLREDHADL
jgi:hypothetical protein